VEEVREFPEVYEFTIYLMSQEVPRIVFQTAKTVFAICSSISVLTVTALNDAAHAIYPVFESRDLSYDGFDFSEELLLLTAYDYEEPAFGVPPILKEVERIYVRQPDYFLAWPTLAACNSLEAAGWPYESSQEICANAPFVNDPFYRVPRFYHERSSFGNPKIFYRKDDPTRQYVFKRLTQEEWLNEATDINLNLLSGAEIVDVSEIGFEEVSSILANTSRTFAPQVQSESRTPVASGAGPRVVAEFSPKGSDVGPVSIANLAASLGYSHFNWLQEITAPWSGAYTFVSFSQKKHISDYEDLPRSLLTSPDPRWEVLSKDGVLLNSPLYDAGHRFWSICKENLSRQVLTGGIIFGGNERSCSTANTDDYKWYFNVPSAPLNTKISAVERISEDGFSTNFHDKPKAVFSTGGSFINFNTTLYGVSPSDFNAGDPINGFTFSWKSNYNCVFWCSGNSQTISIDDDDAPLDGEWVGGAYITSINGVSVDVASDEVPVTDDDGDFAGEGDSGQVVDTPQQVPESSAMLGLMLLGLVGSFSKLCGSKKR